MSSSNAGRVGCVRRLRAPALLRLRSRWRLVEAITIASSVWLARVGQSQEAPQGVIRGVITSDSGRKPVLGAQVQLRERSRGTVTDSTGHFELRDVARGTWHIEIRFFGHAPYSESVSLNDSDTVSVSINLTPAPVSLSGVIVTARGEELPFQLRDFARRRELGGGKFFTRKQLERSGAQTLETFLRARVGGFSFVRLPNGRTALAGKRANELTLSPRRPRVDGLEDRCYVQVFINGQKTYQYISPPFQPPSLDEFPITDLSAIELYRGAADTPTELSGPSAACGTLAIWNNVDNRERR